MSEKEQRHDERRCSGQGHERKSASKTDARGSERNESDADRKAM